MRSLSTSAFSSLSSSTKYLVLRQIVTNYLQPAVNNQLESWEKKALSRLNCRGVNINDLTVTEVEILSADPELEGTHYCGNNCSLLEVGGGEYRETKVCYQSACVGIEVAIFSHS